MQSPTMKNQPKPMGNRSPWSCRSFCLVGAQAPVLVASTASAPRRTTSTHTRQDGACLGATGRGGIKMPYHALRDSSSPWLGMHDPGQPQCQCCYYRYAADLPPTCGWYVGPWSNTYQSYTWMWSHHQAPHAPGPDWSLAVDEAHFMQWYMLADDGQTYVPRPNVPGSSSDGIDAPGRALDAMAMDGEHLIDDLWWGFDTDP